ncbi:MAG: hypothetical protein MJA82_04640 [Clostridia bacterium]|nr:hypothetical protein [Clostridia bacterium]
MKKKKDGVKHGVIEFVPLTQELIELGEKQVTREIDKLKEWLSKDKEKLTRIENEYNIKRKKIKENCKHENAISY